MEMSVERTRKKLAIQLNLYDEIEFKFVCTKNTSIRIK